MRLTVLLAGMACAFTASSCASGRAVTVESQKKGNDTGKSSASDSIGSSDPEEKGAAGSASPEKNEAQNSAAPHAGGTAPSLEDAGDAEEKIQPKSSEISARGRAANVSLFHSGVSPVPKTGSALSNQQDSPVHLSQSIKFSAGQEGFRSGTPKNGVICAAAISAWSDFLGIVDEILKVPPLMLPAVELAEISAALEQELSLCQAHYGPLPPWLPIAVQARLMGIERKLQERHDALQREAAVQKAGKKRRRTPREIAAGWSWPLPHPVVTSDFGPRNDPFSGRRRMHNGVDLRAREPQRVEAIGPGTVTRSGENGGHGISVEVLHEGGFTSVYSHLSLALLDPGDRVEKGDAIGISGGTGRSTAPHLHFELWLGGTPVNPLKYLKDEPEFGCEDWVTPEGTMHICGGNAE